MYAQHPMHFGRHVRIRRHAWKLRQIDLAMHLGVGRQWVIALEAGRPGLDLDLVLRAYKALGLGLQMTSMQETPLDWVEDITFAASCAKFRIAKRPRIRRSRAYLDKLCAQADRTFVEPLDHQRSVEDKTSDR